MAPPYARRRRTSTTLTRSLPSQSNARHRLQSVRSHSCPPPLCPSKLTFGCRCCRAAPHCLEACPASATTTTLASENVCIGYRHREHGFLHGILHAGDGTRWEQVLQRTSQPCAAPVSVTRGLHAACPPSSRHPGRDTLRNNDPAPPRRPSLHHLLILLGHLFRTLHTPLAFDTTRQLQHHRQQSAPPRRRLCDAFPFAHAACPAHRRRRRCGDGPPTRRCGPPLAP